MFANAVKAGGLAGVLAGLLFVLSTVLDQIAPVQSVYESSTDYLYELITLLAFVGAMVAVVGIRALQQRTGRFLRLGAVGTVLTLVGYGVVVVINALSMVRGQRSLVNLRIAGATALLIGSAILGVITLLTHLLPWWCGVLLIVAFPLGDVSNAVFRGGEGILLGLLWGSAGFALLARAGAAMEPDVGQPAHAN
jgi:hypothetical protein